MSQVYVSADIEATGPIPGPYSMIDLGLAAYRDGEVIDTLAANLAELEGSERHPDTMAWWQTQPEAWAACTADPRPPAEVMTACAAWVRGLGSSPVCVIYPTWDFMWLHWYMVRFVGRDPFGIGYLDMKTAAWTVLDLPFRRVTKRRMPAHWFTAREHRVHVGVDDALAQGDMFLGIAGDLKKG